MAEVVHPPALAQKTLLQEAPGGPPRRVALVVPTLTAPGAPFRARVAVLDENELPSTSCTDDLLIRVPGAAEPVATIAFEPGRPAVCSVEGVALGEEGLWRLEAELGGRTFHSNPTSCTLRPAGQVFWGDPHVHTVLSDCHPDRCRSLRFGYIAARHLTLLDWMAVADHVSNGRCTVGKWREQGEALEAFNDPPAFATLPGYEVSLKGGSGGDTNPYTLRWPDEFIDEYDDGNVLTLCRKLREQLGDGEFFVVPHHTSRPGKHGEIPDDIYPGPGAMPVIEIHSRWGTSEYRGNPNPLKKVHPGPSYAADLLNRGLRLGFIGGTDTHTTIPAGADVAPGHIDRLPGMTAVRAPQLDRRAIFENIRRRNCYATSRERIYIDGSIAGLPFGGMTKPTGADTPRDARATVAAKSNITQIDLVRNGRDIRTVSPDDWRAEVEWQDDEPLDELWLESKHLGRFAYYYLRVTCESGAQAWTSPVWIQG
ncbi:MAG: hypothetical protein ACOC46_04190 [Pirellulales bacterium]